MSFRLTFAAAVVTALAGLSLSPLAASAQEAVVKERQDLMSAFGEASKQAGRNADTGGDQHGDDTGQQAGTRIGKGCNPL